MISKVIKKIESKVKENKGMELLQVVLMIALSGVIFALILVAVRKLFPDAMDAVYDYIMGLLNL